MKDEPCKLSFKHWDTKITFEISRSDITHSEFMELIEKLIFSVGFSKKDLEEYIISWGKELDNK